MLAAYTTALPPSTLPVSATSLVAVVDEHVLLAAALLSLAVAAGATLQRVVAATRRRPALRLVDAKTPGARSRRAA